MSESRAVSTALDAAKDGLRKKMAALRRELPLEEAAALSRQAQVNLMDDACWQNARTVLLYAAFKGEMDTGLLLDAAWSEGKQVLLPRCCREGGVLTGALELVPVKAAAELTTGAYGIAEPNPAVCAPPLAGDAVNGSCGVDLVVLPGLAFDANGGRLGYGGGYYDRLSASGALEGARLVGFCFSLQLVPKVPVAAWDIPVHGLCTEERLVWMTQHKKS